ncbi:MFS transporter [Altererythrobacter xixiisoli]|uniref:MFS transporter n=1 Tax=Croceibacterium xixiisoli TaxID=1476466 RepID=A0A6I4U091_9SPHN|nr:MFS transporter [Croceibacterium xixiisoli]MXP00279.1 MFS transporter [Croceibacterium xixiisoli]
MATPHGVRQSAVPHAEPGTAPDAASWPSERAGFYALAVIVFTSFITFLDQTVFGLLAEKMKVSFGISDFELGLLLGPVTVVAYVVVGIPLARLVDLYRRKYVLAASITALSTIMALGGMAQNFMQLATTRLFVGASNSAKGPASYSLLVDYFRPSRIPLVFALLQLGYILGQSLGNIIGGQMIAWSNRLGETTLFLGMEIFSWQLVLLMLGPPGFIGAMMLMTIKEPPRRSTPEARIITPEHAPLARRVAAFIGLDAMRALWARKIVFLPLLLAVAMSAIESQGLPQFRTPFLVRTYGWSEAQIGAVLGSMLLASMIAGVAAGGFFVAWLAKRYKDANVRATAIVMICTTVVTIALPLMPTGELALACMALSSFFGLAGAPAQNAAIQRIVPNEMRGQITAMYLFMFSVFGALGPMVIGGISTFIVGNEQQLWKALLITAAVFMPVATALMWRSIAPYRAEVERLEEMGR